MKNKEHSSPYKEYLKSQKYQKNKANFPAPLYLRLLSIFHEFAPNKISKKNKML
jgi:hypothetical protein